MHPLSLLAATAAACVRGSGPTNILHLESTADTNRAFRPKMNQQYVAKKEEKKWNANL
ncbi:MAG TPA: hypothetical protein VKM94_09295 [Blastocatellia bacterium]|nr:hypothetical protein [Blastocatellia bacterium]